MRARVLSGAICCALFAAGLAIGCGDDGGDAPIDGGDAGAPFRFVFQDLEAALISVAGTSSTDVWTVGADSRDGKGALILHYDGERFTRHVTGIEVDLWWAHPLAADSVYMGGSDGTILHYDGEDVSQMAAPASASTVFGIWGVADDDLWAVGGTPDGTDNFIWHWDGDAWSDRTAELPEAVRAESGGQRRALFKMWGPQADHAFVVGQEGVLVHWDGSRFAEADPDTTRTMATVHGLPDGDPGFVAVGGFGDAVIVESDPSGTRWHSNPPQPALAELFGVYMVSENEGYAVGADGTVAERKDSVWKLLDTGEDILNTFHSVWVDPAGGVWAAGGDLLTAAPDEGMLLHRGEDISDEIIERE
jgi:hypothetical protein